MISILTEENTVTLHYFSTLLNFSATEVKVTNRQKYTHEVKCSFSVYLAKFMLQWQPCFLKGWNDVCFVVPYKDSQVHIFAVRNDIALPIPAWGAGNKTEKSQTG